MTKVLDSRAGGRAVGWGVCCPHPWCHQTLLVRRDPVMSQVKGHLAPTELDGGGSVMPSQGCRALGSSQPLVETQTRGEGPILPSILQQGCLCHLDVCCPGTAHFPSVEHQQPQTSLPAQELPLGHPCPQCPRSPDQQ